MVPVLERFSQYSYVPYSWTARGAGATESMAFLLSALEVISILINLESLMYILIYNMPTPDGHCVWRRLGLEYLS